MIPRARLLFALLLGLSFSTPASAQYMYLDSNGDGIHTTADLVNSAGPTTIDVWLDTQHNRDGSLAVCYPDTTQPLTINSYVFSIRTTNGTATWSGFVNRQATMTTGFGEHSSSTEYENGFGGQAVLPAGRYFLATIFMTIQSGTPSVDIVPSISGTFDVTSFGSQCYGMDFDNTLKLGTDWQDADGLPFGPGGGPNQPPSLAQPVDMTVATGALALQTITATDADHQPLAFSKAAGPAFMAVATQDPGAGTATGQIALTPTAGDVGTTTGTVAVTDGFASAERSFQIAVTAGPNHAPSLSVPAAATAVAGTTPRFPLGAFDPDGQPLAFHKLDGPDFVSVATLAPGRGGAVGSLDLNPTACDVGTATTTIEVTDGVASDSRSLGIVVKALRAAPAQPPAAPANGATVLASGDLNGDGHADLLTGGLFGEVTILLGQGDGTFTPSGLGVSGDEISSVTLGDWNSDGRLDAAATVLGPDHIVILSGDGAGGLSLTEAYAASSFPAIVRSGDLDRDGDLDLVVSQSGGASVYLGSGDGTFAPRTDYAMGGVSHGLVLEDFNLDGRLDVATANIASHDLALRFGLGNGTLGAVAHIALDAAPFDLIARDWNHDGLADLAVGMGSDDIRIYAGDGSGGFTPGATLSGFGDLVQVASADLNLDGNDDLIATSIAVVANQPAIQIAYGHGDGTFGTNRVLTTTEGSGPASADLDEDGFPDVAVAAGAVFLWLNDAGGAGAPTARAFPESNAPAGGKPTTCIRLEPVSDSFRAQDVDLTSVTLSPADGGGSIHASTTKTGVVGDTDANGIAEIPACFSKSDLVALFSTTQGRQTVSAHVEGALVDGRRFCSSVSFDIIGTGRKLAASLSPNPLNPGGTLRLITSRDGFVRVRMFDLQGRVVRVLEDRAMVPAGAHDVQIDGRNAAGQTLASGVYFYQVETAEGSLKGRITVLK